MNQLQLFILVLVVSLRSSTGFFLGETNFATPLSTRNANAQQPSPNVIRSNVTTALIGESKTKLAFVPNTGNSYLSRPSSSSSSFHLYCDLDGVLVDFEGGFVDLTGKPTAKIAKQTMWKHIVRANAFFENLRWTKDGQVLWEAIKHLEPDILTGCPSHESSRTEKFNWCHQQLGVDRLHHVDMASGFRHHRSVNGNRRQEGFTNIITCWSENKFRECTRAGSILIDDRDDLRPAWEAAGGLFVHHTDAKNTLRQLKAHGIL
ncbi:unnamed protein product [Cylindrotheca closterium]|uniref:Swiss Army Knife RNA repair protein HAD domain-containing protein n=1 Tax=Cylindrotheca closterium TaxID=2856 RepID=A0AAD2FVX8_9STRA|nr:unnamed protein product [Cylindrotheca closterium]